MPEHTIAENLARLQSAKTAIGNAIVAKGGTVNSGDGLEEYPTDIASIETANLTSISITENGVYSSSDAEEVESSTLPIVIEADGTPLLDFLISGNMSQSGTPTPSSPIQPQETGDLETTGEHSGQYKIPISSSNTTTPVYLGEVQTTRQTGKLVLTGAEENWMGHGAIQSWYQLTIDDAIIGNLELCTHYKPSTHSAGDIENGEILAIKQSTSNSGRIIIKDTNCATKADFLAYLASQYAAGTPVTIWYVLATPETGIVNEPLRKIGDYADTLSMEQAGVDIQTNTSPSTTTIDIPTTLPPSLLYVEYNTLSTTSGYNIVDVNVPNTYASSDEGKVVSNGSLVSQTAKPTEITTNNTYDTTTYNSVTVNVENSYTASDEGKVVNNGTLVSQTAKPTEITTNNTYDTTMYNSVTVNISSEPQEQKDVNFYDYEGTIVKSYTAAEFANISELPDNPSHEGLTAQGWNWSLADAKAYVAKYGKLEIGQTYVTSDGKTRIYITLTEGRISPIFQLYLDAYSELDIDWGDGSTHSTFTTTTSAGYVNERHNYATAGDYVIAITVTTGSFEFKTPSARLSSILSNGNDNVNSPDSAYLNSIKKVEIGTGITSIGDSAFNHCYSLSSITIPDSVTSSSYRAFEACYSLLSITIPDTFDSFGTNTFNNCYSLTSITIPNSIIFIGDFLFNYCYSLTSIIIPDSVTHINPSAFMNCTSFTSIIIPDSVKYINSSVFNNCTSLTSITIPDSVTNIGKQAFQYCYSLSSVTIGNSVTSIGSNVFSGCSYMESIKFKSTTPPTVSNSNAWDNVPTTCKIYIPSGSFAAYTAATNYPSPLTYTYVQY